MITVHLIGSHCLPRSVKAERLALAVQDVGEMMGVKGKIVVDVSPRASKCVGRCAEHVDGSYLLRLYAPQLRIYSTRSIRYAYAITTAHELVHISQMQRGVPYKVLMGKIAEDEALNSERVYGPEVERWLVRLVTPPGGKCLDPFLGSGSTALACILEDVEWIGIEREAEYVEIAEARVKFMVEFVARHGRPPIDMGTAQAVKAAEAKDDDPRQVDLFDRGGVMRRLANGHWIEHDKREPPPERPSLQPGERHCIACHGRGFNWLPTWGDSGWMQWQRCQLCEGTGIDRHDLRPGENAYKRAIRKGQP